MIIKYDFESKRLGFRRWNNDDRVAFADMNSNSKVMEYFPNSLTLDESNTFIDRIEKHFETYGYGLWAVELKSTNELIGFIGFSHPNLKDGSKLQLHVLYSVECEGYYSN